MTAGTDMARALLDAVVDDAEQPNTPPSSADRPIKLAIVDPAYSGVGLPKVTFEGETTMTVKGYPYLEATPVAGSRVALAPIGRGYVILGASGLTGPYAALVARVSALESRALQGVVQGSISKSGTSASIDAAGLVDFAGVSRVSWDAAITGPGIYDLHAWGSTSAGATVTTRVRGASTDCTTASHVYTATLEQLAAGPARSSSSTAGSFGFFCPTTAGSGSSWGGVIRLYVSALNAVVLFKDDTISTPNGDRYEWKGGGNTPSGFTLDGVSIICSSGTITGKGKLVKIA